MWVWLAVFLSTAAADVAWTMYFIETENRHAVKASAWSTAIVAFGSFTTFQFVHNAWLITATLAGAFAGTYATVKRAARKA